MKECRNCGWREWLGNYCPKRGEMVSCLSREEWKEIAEGVEKKPRGLIVQECPHWIPSSPLKYEG
jgi:hypothetical protein